MDLLSGVITTMKLGKPKFSSSQRSSLWGNRFGPYPGAGFHIVLSGSCWLISGSEPPWLMSAGDVVFLPHGAVHGMSDRPDVRLGDLPPDPGDTGGHLGRIETSARVHLLCGAYRFDRNLAHPFLQSLPDIIRVPASTCHAELPVMVNLLRDELTGTGAGSAAVVPALLDLVVVLLLRAWVDEQSGQQLDHGWVAALEDPVLLRALDAVHSQLAQRWTVQSLANTVGMSRTAFARRFTHVLGQPPMTYLTWYRLTTAARILSGGDDPLASVAHQVGYTSEFAFASAFRRQFHLPPGQFRQKRRDAVTARAPTG